MLFHPIINQLANIDLTLLVKPADKQLIEGEIACFCPFCQRRNGTGEKEQGNVGCDQTPHFIIYRNERGGLYSGVGCDDNKQASKGAIRWICTKTGKRGYGAIELYAAIRNIPMFGASLLRLCRDLVVKVYGENASVKSKWPMLFEKMDYRALSTQDINTFHFQPKTDFNPQELFALGCEVTMKDGIPSFSFGEDFNTSRLNEDFRIYAIDQLTLPKVIRNGRMVSEVIYGTPWNPLFVCYATENIGWKNVCGCFFRPAMQSDPIVFSTSEEHSVKKVSKWLMGDKVFTYAINNRDSSSTAVHAALCKFQPDETFETTKDKWEEKLDKDGNPKGTFRLVQEDIPTSDIKSRNIVYCRTPEDAISLYYAMQSLRVNKKNDQHFQKYCWYHVAFSVGRRNFWYIEHGEWRQEKLDFNSIQYQKMNRFADRVILLYPNDISSQRDGGAIATKYSDICYATLPDAFHVRYNQRWTYLFGCTPRSVRDYLLAYRMTDEDNFKFDHDIRIPLYSRLRGAKCTDPFEIDYPRDPRSGKPKPPTCKVSPTKLWLFMTAHGYYRMIDTESTDLVGQYIRLDRCFVEYIEAKSIIQAAKTLLLDFIEQSWRYNDNEQKLMSDCANLIDKTFSDRSAGGLQSIVINFSEAFNANTEYFYFRNVALKITPDSIIPVSYDSINFFIPSLARKPYDFTIRKIQPPFSISERLEYQQRTSAINEKEKMRNEDGSPVYSTIEIGQMRAELEEWSQTYRWQVDWKGKKEQELWPILRIVRGCSNVLWQKEQEAERNNVKMSADDIAVMNSHFANMISCIGRLCYRSWDEMQSICPYLLEDNIVDEKQATGGSGKSVMINLIVGAAVNVLSIDMKEFLTISDAKFCLSDLLVFPGKYRVVHWEDKPKSFPMKYFYNKVSSGTKVERKFGDPVIFKMEDSPLHVITSNSPLSDDDDSTIGRFPLVSFSDRFARANPQKRKPARSPKDVMKKFRMEPEHLTEIDRNQTIYLCALAVQFIMRYHTFAIAPQGNVRRRQMVQKLTESIVRYFEWFFSRDKVYGIPICTDEMFNEFMRDWADASEGKSKEYSRATFKKKIYDYCENMSIICNPKHLFENESDKQRKCFKLKAWVTQEYFVGREWENDNTIEPKYIRYMQTSKHVFFFYRPGKDTIPADYKELKKIAKDFSEQPDPMPYRDYSGNIVTLTDEEKKRWEDNKLRKQGRRYAVSPSKEQTTNEIVQTINESDLPF